MFFLPILSLLVAGKEQVKYTFKKTKNKLKSEHTGIYQQKPPSCKPHFYGIFPPKLCHFDLHLLSVKPLKDFQIPISLRNAIPSVHMWFRK